MHHGYNPASLAWFRGGIAVVPARIACHHFFRKAALSSFPKDSSFFSKK